jgi:hypothetical protein
MAFSADPVKLRSQRVWLVLLTAATVGLGGCIIVDDDHHRGDPGGVYVDPGPTEEPKLVSIDTDAAVSAEPGEGVGLFVEYAAGGTWRLSTTCDTNYSGVACGFDVFASVDASSELLDITADDLEGRDQTGLVEEGVVGLHAETASDVDAVSFTTTPGAIVRLETYLDGASQPRFVYWFGDGVLHEGAPTNPLDFEPTEP